MGKLSSSVTFRKLKLTTEEHAVSLGKVSNDIAVREREDALLGLRRVLQWSGQSSRPLDRLVDCMKLTHFMLFAAVICPNIALSLRMAVYAVSLSSPLSVAVPK